MKWLIAVALALVATLAAAQTAKSVSVWSGVYTAAQAKRGEQVHTDVCAMCHGPRLNGAGQSEMPPSPAIAGSAFLRKWAGRNVAALFLYIRQTMPPDSPGTVTNQQTADAIAHMFAVSNMPVGDKELPLDPKALANIMIEAQR
jgi:S-disulfanyl-L-cysteine oxidoreductase SoxD